MMYDVDRVRQDFPVLQQEAHGHPLAYLDNAATTQKPQQVIDAVRDYYERDNSNVHRGVHLLSERATQAYEGARERIARFVGGEPTSLIFTRGTTEAVNLVAQTHVRSRVARDDEIVITHLEHHSNIVPWQMLCQQTGAKLRVAPITDEGVVDLDAYQALLGPRTRFASFAHVSNALGTINPVRAMTEIAHDAGATVLVDGAQAVPHDHVDVRSIGCDFYAFSGHKMYGPTGIGGLHGRAELLEEMPPYQGGGDMIASVSFEKTTYNDVPYKFEAGTPNIAGAVGLGAAVEYLSGLGIAAIKGHENALLAQATQALDAQHIRIVGTAPDKAAVLSFEVQGVHPHDVGSLLDHEGIAIRTGHHCAQPVMERFRLPATCRASFGLYNTAEEVDRLAAAVQKVVKLFA